MSQTILELIDINPETDKAELEVDDKILKIKKAYYYLIYYCKMNFFNIF